MQGGGPLESAARGALVSEQEVGLPLRGGGVVRALVVGCQRVEGRPRQKARLLRLARHEAERRGVDRGVVAAGARMDRAVQGERANGLGAPPLLGGLERDVLGDARAEGGDVVFVGRLQPVALEPPRRLFGGARARQREHGAVLQPEIIGTLGQALLGEIDRGQQLAAPLRVLDSLEPVCGRTLRRRHSHPNW